MEDGTIKDCQITASSDDGTSTAADVRPNADGWVSALDRGPPLYQNEYVQVTIILFLLSSSYHFWHGKSQNTISEIYVYTILFGRQNHPERMFSMMCQRIYSKYWG